MEQQIVWKDAKVFVVNDRKKERYWKKSFYHNSPKATLLFYKIEEWIHKVFFAGAFLSVTPFKARKHLQSKLKMEFEACFNVGLHLKTQGSTKLMKLTTAELREETPKTIVLG